MKITLLFRWDVPRIPYPVQISNWDLKSRYLGNASQVLLREDRHVNPDSHADGLADLVIARERCASDADHLPGTREDREVRDVDRAIPTDRQSTRRDQTLVKDGGHIAVHVNPVESTG